MKKAILATKVGMTQIFNADGVLVPVTVLQAGPCVVTQVKTVENDGYSAVQVGFVDKKEKVVNKDANGNTVSLTYKDVDYIVVHVLDKGKGSGCPMYTDSVKVNYRGRMLGTDTYPAGYVFDKTFDGTYDKTTAQVATYAVNSLVDGFTTALLNMHIGDRWMVYMPYQLAYGTTQSSSSTIPAYSMLRFEIVLDSYYRIGQVVPGSRAVEAGKKQGTWITE